MNDFRPDLARAAIGTVAGSAVLIVDLLALRNRLAIAGEWIGRAGGSGAPLRLGGQNGQRKEKTDQKCCGRAALHGFFSAAVARSGRPKVKMLVPDAIARYW